MTKADLIESATNKSGLPRQSVENIINDVFNGITAALKSGDKVNISGFGTFSISQRKARTGRNPKTGESIQITASRAAKFKAGKGLKESLAWEAPDRNVSLPFGSILDRYLVRSFNRVFVPTLMAIGFVYFTVEFFDRIDNLMRAGASAGAATRYFLYKIPLLISRVFGFATLFSTLLTIGMLSRTYEITAMRASGLSLHRLAAPLLFVSMLIGMLSFMWNESLVPLFTRKSQYIYKVEVKNQTPKSLIGTQGIWIRGKEAFISVDYFDAKKNILQGVTIYLINSEFTLQGLIESPEARWDGSRWRTGESTGWTLLSDGRLSQQQATVRVLPISEKPEDFKILARKAEEFNFFELKRQIKDLTDKGIDTTEYAVDLQVKLAFPMIPSLMVLLAIPFALKQGTRAGVAISFGFTMLIGLAHLTLMAFCVSLGHSGAMQPWMAAWLPNFVLALVGIYYMTGEE